MGERVNVNRSGVIGILPRAFQFFSSLGFFIISRSVDMFFGCFCRIMDFREILIPKEIYGRATSAYAFPETARSALNYPTENGGVFKMTI